MFLQIMGLVTCAGATPVDTDFSTWETDSFGVAKGTGKPEVGVYKDATDVYYVEMTGDEGANSQTRQSRFIK